MNMCVHTCVHMNMGLGDERQLTITPNPTSKPNERNTEEDEERGQMVDDSCVAACCVLGCGVRIKKALHDSFICVT